MVELICVIVILGVLAAQALPKFMDIGVEARLAALKQLEAALRTAASQTRALCMVNKTSTGCDVSAGSWTGTINGKNYVIGMGWPDAGDNIGGNQIDTLVSSSGFNVSIPNWDRTLFAVASAPVPTTCSIAYLQANFFGSHDYQLITTTTGC